MLSKEKFDLELMSTEEAMTEGYSLTDLILNGSTLTWCLSKLDRTFKKAKDFIIRQQKIGEELLLDPIEYKF
jgi:hypothetical protein